MTMHRIGKTTITQTNRELTFSRTFNAPRELVFQAFSTPEHVSQWWGPKNWPVTACTMEFRPGGVWHYCLTGPSGEEHWGRAVYQEIDGPNKIVFTNVFADAAGNPDESLPKALTTVTFTEMGGKTTLTSHIQYHTAKELDTVLSFGMVQGTCEGLDFLEQHLESQILNKEGV